MVFDGWKMYDLTMTLGHDYPAFPIGLQDVRIVRDVRRARYTANADKIVVYDATSGKLTYEPNPDGGCKFTVYLPIVDAVTTPSTESDDPDA